MPTKKLFLLCDNYPFSSGEFFIDDEMRIIANKFENILVFVPQQKKQSVKRFIPQNLKIIEFDNKITIGDKIKNIIFLFKNLFYNELKSLEKAGLKVNLTLFKIMYMDFVRANKLKTTLKKHIQKENIEINNSVFYSYWHDYKALTITLLKNEEKNIVGISRSHGWDNFKDRQTPAYLPFKNYILQNLSQTYCISEAGKQEFLKYGNFQNKIRVSRLGKDNNREPLFEKKTNIFHIVSCSNIISLKRINLIIDLIAQINIQNVTWTHFGDGYLRNEIESYAKEKLKNCNFEFKGIVENSKILDFYANNYIDLFINVSEQEGIPVSIMEAISAGISVVATNVGGTNEIINSKNGFLINEHFSINDVANIIKNYLLMPKEKHEEYRKNAYQFWQEDYNATKNYMVFYNQITQL